METPQPPTSTLQYIVYVLAIPFAGAVGALFKRWYQRKIPTQIEQAEVRERDSNVVEKAWHRMDQMQSIIDTQGVEIIRLREIERKYNSLRPYTKRCEDRLKANQIDVPERWQPEDDVG